MQNLSKYLLAILPPQPIQQEIMELKMEVSEKFGSHHALNAPPHITLLMPFQWKNHKEELLFEFLSEINESIIPFDIQLNGFDFFKPRVVFVDVVANEQLTEFQRNLAKKARRQLKLMHPNHQDRAFHPHITIGFRDLKKKAFYEAKTYYEQQFFSANFKVNKIDLLRKEDKIWTPISSE